MNGDAMEPACDSRCPNPRGTCFPGPCKQYIDSQTPARRAGSLRRQALRLHDDATRLRRLADETINEAKRLMMERAAIMEAENVSEG